MQGARVATGGAVFRWRNPSGSKDEIEFCYESRLYLVTKAMQNFGHILNCERVTEAQSLKTAIIHQFVT